MLAGTMKTLRASGPGSEVGKGLKIHMSHS